jgi:hypothetical protein
VTKYDPEEFLESTIRVLKEYLEQEFHRSVSVGAEYVGEQAYEVVPQFPGPDLDTRKMPMQRTIIHFEIDDIQSAPLGMGEGIYDQTYDPATEMVTGRTGEGHLINLDVGIWASDASGGSTSRSRAKQILQNSLGGSRGVLKMREFSDAGVEDGTIDIMSFSGGRFVMDRINDMQVFRMIECTLVVRVFSRVPLDDAQTGPAIIEIPIDPDTWIRNESGNLEPVE